jgi:transcriptional regulator with XRE-family HTH domain
MAGAKSEEIQRAMAILKDELRGRNLSYAAVARAMSVSERTVQRWMNDDHPSLDLIATLCETVDISLSELFALAEHADDPRPRRLTVEQEQALVDTPMLGFLFTRLLQGWTAGELQRVCGLSEADIVRHLTAFDRLGLITLYPGNRIRLLTRRTIDWRPGGPMRRNFEVFARSLMSAIDFGAESAIWTSEAVHLTDATAAAIDERLQALRAEVRRLAALERGVAPERKRWYSLLLLAHRHDPNDPADPLSAIFALRRSGA